MIPSKYYDTSGCDPMSSNCVIWQGPDLDCIDICNGDTVSIVIAKIAERLCQLTSQDCTLELDISGIILNCLEDYIAANNLSNPQTIQDLVQIIILQICELNDNITEDSCCDTYIPLPACLQYTEPTTGQLVSQMLIVDYVQYLATQICSVAEAAGLPGQTPWGQDIENKIRKLERTSQTTTYSTPKIIHKYIGTSVGKRTTIDNVIAEVEKDYGIFKSSIGGATAIKEAAKKQPLSLSGSKRLNAESTYNTMAGWVISPTTLSQSFGNAWLTIGDIRSAIVDLQAISSPTTCSAITYDAEVSLVDSSKVVSGIRVSFTGCTVPNNFKSCNSALGCKIIIKDSSLTTVTSHCFPEQLQNNNNGWIITELGQLDTTSNFEVTIEFCFTDGASECAKTITKTLTNNVLCPTITTSSITSEGFSYNISGIDTTLKSTVTVIIEDSSENVLQSTPYTSPSAVITGSIANLSAGSAYSVHTTFTSTSGNITTCEKTTVTTGTPSCVTVYKETADFTTAFTDFRSGATKTVVSCYNDGVNTTEVIVGFDSSNNIIVYKGTGGGGTCTASSLVTYGTFISDNPTQQLTCNSVNYAATGITSSMTTSGWQY